MKDGSDIQKQLESPATRLYVMRFFVASAAVSLILVAAAAFMVGQGNSQRERELNAELEVRVEAAVEAAIAEYDKRVRAELDADHAAIERFYEDTTREVDSFVTWRLDEVLRETNRLMDDAVVEQERIIREAKARLELE